ncbi:MAG: DUF4835 family protein [Bacteroidales bacterium]|nr:DUF4835 family protein [Bacteroidales bacterium]
MRRFLAIMLTITMFGVVCAQEFRCAVTVNYQKLLTTQQAYESAGDKKVFDNMKTAIENFVNGRHWTNIEFEQTEKIDCSFSLILSERSSATDFKGQLSIQLRRPVYNSSYTSGLFNYIESGDFAFSYNDAQPLDFDPNTFYSNLSSTLAYYCYILLGYYFDSFAPYGGEPFYGMAQTVQQTAEQSGFKGWRSDTQKSRYWFMENHTNSAYAKLHDVYYTYHRLGLDMMTKDQKQARAAIIQALKLLQEVNKTQAKLLSTQQFIDVKMAEIISIFTPAPPEEQKEVYTVIKEVSPINAVKLKDFNTK